MELLGQDNQSYVDCFPLPFHSLSAPFATRRMSLKTWRKKILQCVKVAFPFHAAAWKASSEPIQRMLEEPDNVKQDQLTASWKEGTQSQLNVISVTVCIRDSRDFVDPHLRNVFRARFSAPS